MKERDPESTAFVNWDPGGGGVDAPGLPVVLGARRQPSTSSHRDHPSQSISGTKHSGASTARGSSTETILPSSHGPASLLIDPPRADQQPG